MRFRSSGQPLQFRPSAANQARILSRWKRGTFPQVFITFLAFFCFLIGFMHVRFIFCKKNQLYFSCWSTVLQVLHSGLIRGAGPVLRNCVSDKTTPNGHNISKKGFFLGFQWKLFTLCFANCFAFRLSIYIFFRKWTLLASSQCYSHWKIVPQPHRGPHHNK